MRQAWRIFSKDVRHLRFDVALFLALAAAFAWSASHTPEPVLAEGLLLASGAFTLVRLIHGEALTGDRQFWVTRPYRWSSLLGAKLLFMALCLGLPLALAQAASLLALRLPLLSSLPGLVCSQAAVMVCLALPVAAAASLTNGVASFATALLALVALGANARLLAWSVGLLPRMAGSTNSSEWIRDTAAVAWLALLAAAVLILQYRRCGVGLARAVAIAGLVAGGLGYLAFPWRAALALQTAFSSQPALAAPIGAVHGAPTLFVPERYGEPSLQIPVAIQGVPQGTLLRADGFTLTLETAEGGQWRSELSGANRYDSELRCDLRLPWWVWREWRKRPLKARITLWLTLFGDPRAKTMRLTGEPVDAVDGLQCFAGVFEYKGNRSLTLACRSPYRWPERLVLGQTAPNQTESLNNLISYSPFPAGLDLTPLVVRSIGGPSSADPTVTVTSWKPLAHFRRDLMLEDLRLDRLTGRSSWR